MDWERRGTVWNARLVPQLQAGADVVTKGGAVSRHGPTYGGITGFR
jgi:hypothetical protein